MSTAKRVSVFLASVGVVFLLPLALSRVDVAAQERVQLAAPVTFDQTGWDVSTILLDVERMRIVIRLKSTGTATSVVLEKTYDGAVGDSLLRALNKANLTTRSLIERVYDRLISDGVIQGTVTGAPR